eukprot:NODE_178_length_2557_cov_10.792265_g135_i0.p1 GENE.NODE_178_length_2557_cov_10.792265_g135_i0~~NODE_178_length_2557_cov_10.792265_g135_i0.p1  ORF type:complete len:841 (-),score=178.13 NODE_178_length_2557_cov_10.792265_g135_i0:35-2383(-)
MEDLQGFFEKLDMGDLSRFEVETATETWVRKLRVMSGFSKKLVDDLEAAKKEVERLTDGPSDGSSAQVLRRNMSGLGQRVNSFLAASSGNKRKLSKDGRLGGSVGRNASNLALGSMDGRKASRSGTIAGTFPQASPDQAIAVLQEEIKRLKSELVSSTLRGPRAAAVAAGVTAQRAPRAEAAIVVADTADVVALWAENAGATRQALHIAGGLMRAMMRTFGGYEAVHNPSLGGFMFIFHSAATALRFCVAVQEALSTLDWPPFLISESAVAPTTSNGMFRGLRCRMGISFGKPHHRICPSAGRLIYSGTAVNLAGRLCQLRCRPGEIVCTQEAFVRVKKDDSQFLGTSCAFSASGSVSGVNLGGGLALGKPVKVFSIFPRQFAARVEHYAQPSFNILTLGSPAAQESPNTASLLPCEVDWWLQASDRPINPAVAAKNYVMDMHANAVGPHPPQGSQAEAQWVTQELETQEAKIERLTTCCRSLELRIRKLLQLADSVERKILEGRSVDAPAMLRSIPALPKGHFTNVATPKVLLELHKRVRLFYSLIQAWTADPKFPFVDFWVKIPKDDKTITGSGSSLTQQFSEPAAAGRSRTGSPSHTPVGSRRPSAAVPQPPTPQQISESKRILDYKDTRFRQQLAEAVETAHDERHLFDSGEVSKLTNSMIAILGKIFLHFHFLLKRGQVALQQGQIACAKLDKDGKVVTGPSGAAGHGSPRRSSIRDIDIPGSPKESLTVPGSTKSAGPKSLADALLSTKSAAELPPLSAASSPSSQRSVRRSKISR